MALILLQPGLQPLGQYDAVDGYALTIKGGEVCTFTTVAVASDKAAADALDGYLNPGTSRVALTVNLNASGMAPLMLTDEGTANYGTLFGTVVGGTAGAVQTGGAVLGPHTATGTGKWTAWDKPGMYGVTLDATDQDATNGLQPTTSVTAGEAVYCTSLGLLTRTANKGTTQSIVGRFAEFRTNGALVTTPNRLVSALNSPSSTVSGTLGSVLFMATFHFNPQSQ